MLLQEHLFSELCVLFFLNTLRYNFKTNKMCYFMGDSSMHFDKLMCALSHFSHVWFCATLWTIASQAPLSMGFSRQECWSGLPRPPPGDLPDPGIKPTSLTSSALAGESSTTSVTWEAIPKMFPCVPGWKTAFPHFQPLTASDLLCVFLVLPFPICYVRGIIKYCSLLSLASFN